MSSAKSRVRKDRRSLARKSGRSVVIVGAGVAGLAAAAALRAQGIRFTILEARGRIGGRVWTKHPSSLTVPVELGAEFMHGEADETAKIADDNGLRTLDIAGRRWRSKSGALSPLDDFWERLDRVMRRLHETGQPDRTFAEALARNRSIGKEDRALATQYVTGFHAANPAIISEHALAEGGSPRADVRERRIGRVVDGYDSIIAALADGLSGRVKLRSVVNRIEWRPGRVTVSFASGRESRRVIADAAIIAVPLGVLAAAPGNTGAIEFDPRLPAKESAIAAMTMGTVSRIALQFDEPFWTTKRFASHVGDDRLDTLAFLHGMADIDFPVWWTSYPIRSPLLIGWRGGPRVLQLAELPAAALEQTALASLAELLSMKPTTLRRHLVSSFSHNWTHDPFSRGAYSYARVGGDDAPKRLARPVDGTLFFAGEAADPEGRTGTVHGAVATGQRAADEVIRALD